MKVCKVLLLSAGFILLAFSLSAVDYGVVIDSRSSIDLAEGADAEFTPREKVSVWAENSWESGDTLYSLSGNVFYLFNENEDHIFDADLLKLGIKQKNFLSTGTVLDASLGRFRFSDATGLVFSHVADGARGRFDFGDYAFTAGVGYTGLQLKPEANVSMTISDAIDEDDDDIYFAPRRLIEQFRLEMPVIDKGQFYTLEGLVQQDLRDDSDTLNSLHLTTSAEGKITDKLFYDLSAVNALDLSSKSSGIMFKAGLYYSLEDFYYSRISGGLLWGSSNFFSISSPTVGTIFSPGLSDSSRINIDYSLRPWADRMSPMLRNLQFVLGGNRFSSAGEYMGTEIIGKIKIKPASDFGAGLTMGTYLPDNGDIQGLIRLDVSLGL